VVSGEVSDPQGALVRGAQIVAAQTTTGLQRTTTSNGSGLFVINDVAPGKYELRVSAAGFAPYVGPVRLEVGQQATVRIRLSLQSQQTTVDVSDLEITEEVSTTSSVVDGVVNSRQIDNLPLNGRNFLELALLMPGNTIAPNFDPTKQNTVVISTAGQLGRGGNVSIDGMDDNDDVVGGMLLNVPEDSVQEFQVASNRFSAELGRSASAVVNVVTKSGSNSLHGSAAIYERDKVLQAAPAEFNTSASISRTPPFRRQQYAGTVGGPIVKDKAWWFGAFEYRDEIGGLLVATRNPRPGGGGTITNSFASTPLTDPMATLRADWQVSSRDTLSLHYGIERQNGMGVTPFLSSEPIGSSSQRQDSRNNFQTFQGAWSRVLGPSLLNRASYSFNNFVNRIGPVTPGPELDFPSLAGGASFDSPQSTWQKRSQFADNIDWTQGKHNLHAGGEFQRIGAAFDLGVFRSGVIVFVQDFANQDRNGDGVIDDKDLLFAVAIRSATPTRDLIIPNADNNHIAVYFQDDWRVHPQFNLNLGLRYELDTDVNDVGHYNQINPILMPFLHGTRHKDTHDFGPRIGFNLSNKSGRASLHGGYGIYYDRITLELESLERGLDGRALPINVSLGSANFLDPKSGNFIPGLTPTYPDTAFNGPIIPGAGGAAEGINVIDNNIRNPMVQQFNLGVQYSFAKDWVLKVDGIHNYGMHFIIGVPVGSVFNPVSGGPETVTDLQASAKTHYDALWLTVDKRFAQRYQFHGSYALSKALNYANYDQVPFGYPPVDSTNLRREYGFAPNDQRHRLVLQGTADLPFGLRFSPLWTYASGVPMDILLGDGSGHRLSQLGRNAGGRQFHTGAELNLFLTQLNAQGASDGSLGVPFPMVSPAARFDDTFNSFDLRLSKQLHLSERFSCEVIGETFNLFNKTNILGTSKNNYSGFFNALVPDSTDPNNPGYGHSSGFGRPVSTAGGVFGSGGPRAFQLAAKLTF
jgi:hypothetical protein